MTNKLYNLWDEFDYDKYQYHITISSGNQEETIEKHKMVYLNDLKKRKEAYGTCGECKKPGTGNKWCQPCNAERFKKNFNNWCSGNDKINELIRQSQLSAVFHKKCLEWIPYEKFDEVTYITTGGFGKIYSARWSEGFICYWDIENKEWNRKSNTKVALKRLNNFSNIITDFLNEIKSHLQIYLMDIIQCYGITQDPKNKDYMMVLQYCDNGNLREYIDENSLEYGLKIEHLYMIARGLSDIHNAGKVHGDLHPGNILFIGASYISDLGMCQLEKDEKKSVDKRVYGVLPYMAPEVLRGFQYTKASDIYSFGIIMHEFITEEIPYYGSSHDCPLAIDICKGLRPKISHDVPKLLGDLIMKCWDAEAKNRPTAKEISQVLKKWDDEIKNHYDKDSENGEDNEDNEGKYSEDSEDSEDDENNKVINEDNENNNKNSDNDDYNADNENNDESSEYNDKNCKSSNKDNGICFQIKECEKFREKRPKKRSESYPGASYISRPFNVLSDGLSLQIN